MTLEQDILRILTQARDEIRANMASKGVNASGRTSRGFAVEKYDKGVRLVLNNTEKAVIQCEPRPPRGLSSVTVGVAPLSTLEIGREAGRVPRGFYYMVKQWTRDKGLRFASESERQTFSYFAARKIAKEGTRKHREPSFRTDVYSTPVEKAKTEVMRAAVQSFSTFIQTAINNFNNGK